MSILVGPLSGINWSVVLDDGLVGASGTGGRCVLGIDPASDEPPIIASLIDIAPEKPLPRNRAERRAAARKARLTSR